MTINASLFVSSLSLQTRQKMTTIMLNGNKINFYLVLLTLIASLRSCDMTAINNHLSTESRHVMKVEESSATEKLLQIRDLVKTLFFDWNFGGESEIEGNKCKPFCSAF